ICRPNKPFEQHILIVMVNAQMVLDLFQFDWKAGRLGYCKGTVHCQLLARARDLEDTIIKPDGHTIVLWVRCGDACDNLQQSNNIGLERHFAVIELEVITVESGGGKSIPTA